MTGHDTCLQVPSDLMQAPGDGNGFDQGVAPGGTEAADARHRVDLRPALAARDRMVMSPSFG